MIPKPPPREGALGFLYLPPYRVIGESVAGEATTVVVPELDVCFDAGCCPRAILASKFLCISHGHMDHVGSLAYFCSQRYFQGMGEATIVCSSTIAPAIHGMMKGYIDLERQETPYKLVALEPEGTVDIKSNMYLKGIPLEHAHGSMGFVVVERRSKLKEEFAGLPQEKLKELKDRGVEITRKLEIPQIAYLGDTAPGPALVREDVRKAHVVICECTFTEPEHRERARVGLHMHAEDIAEWLRVLECGALILIHFSRRTNLGLARKRIEELVGPEKSQKVHFLMDHRANRARYEKQLAEAGEKEGAGVEG
ncbi:MAG: MBL fold metallo-hydrolase [Phycisphaerales bacterium]